MLVEAQGDFKPRDREEAAGALIVVLGLPIVSKKNGYSSCAG